MVSSHVMVPCSVVGDGIVVSFCAVVSGGVVVASSDGVVPCLVVGSGIVTSSTTTTASNSDLILTILVTEVLGGAIAVTGAGTDTGADGVGAALTEQTFNSANFIIPLPR